MSSNKAPSAGTKVTSGSAPVYREGAGAVAPDSLAAESATFTRANRNAEPGSGPAPTKIPAAIASSARGGGEFSSRGEGSGERGSSSKDDDPLKHQKSYAGPAPTYVNVLYMKDPAGPHGKNIKEVESFEGEPVVEGLDLALKAEPGSELDPGRAAEARFGLTGEGKVLGKPSGVPVEKGGHMFRPLDSDASA